MPLFALAAALDARYRLAFWSVSALCAINMYLFYGLGDGWPPIIGRSWTGVDFSVIVACVVCGVWVWLTVKPPVSALVQPASRTHAGTRASHESE